jgi:ATP-dependent RNA helicase DHX57
LNWFQGGVRPAKDDKPDEKLSSKQIFLRYSKFGEKVCKTLSTMDFEKIDYDLIEATLLHIVDCYPKEGSILVFLPGMQEIMTAFDQVVLKIVLLIYFSQQGILKLFLHLMF